MNRAVPSPSPQQDEGLDPPPMMCALVETSQRKDRDDPLQIEHSMFNLQNSPYSRHAGNAVVAKDDAHAWKAG